MLKRIVTRSTLLLFGVLFPVFAAAQVPTVGNVYFGYTYYNTDLGLNRGSFNGWQGTLEGKLFPMLGVVADITGHYGNVNVPVACPVGAAPCTSASQSAHVYESMFGPRVSIPIGKFRPFGEFEFGVGHVNTDRAGSDTSFATAVGGGLDYRIFRPLAWRFEGDYVHTRLFNAGQSNLRISTGIVLRF